MLECPCLSSSPMDVKPRYSSHKNDGMMMAASQMAPLANIFLIHAIGPCERLATAAISARYFEKNAMTAPSGASQGVTRKIHP